MNGQLSNERRNEKAKKCQAPEGGIMAERRGPADRLAVERAPRLYRHACMCLRIIAGGAAWAQ